MIRKVAHAILHASMCVICKTWYPTDSEAGACFQSHK